MFGKKVFAAMLATVLGASLFGANAAKAVINLDATDRSSAVATYATETLTRAVPDSDGYYMVDSSPTDTAANLNVMGMVGLGGPDNSVVTIRFDLRGLVFSTTVMEGDLTSGDNNHDDISIRTGGEVGSNYVSFLASRMENATRASDVTLAIGNIGVKPGVAGSVTMTVRDTLGPEMVTLNYNGAIRTAKALQEAATPKNAEATVEHRFVSFDGSPTATLGSFMVGMKLDPPLLNATGGAPVELSATDGAPNHVIDPSMGTVTFEGDFSFASRVWLEDEAADGATVCGMPTPDQRTLEDDRMLNELAVMPNSVLTAQDLCIEVPTEEMAMAIPETDPYTVTTKYTPGTTDAEFPPTDREHSLGQITRDGTTVHIPFLTTWADYNQRIVISNRGANSAPYWITFRPEDGVMATPGMYATGTLDGNSTMVLRAMDVVTLVGGTRTAVTFVAEAQRSKIDVATVIVNMMTGSTDTVNYD